MSFKCSENGKNLIKSFEGCRLTAYKLEGETYFTIGWGHYGSDVYEGMTITQEEADNLFDEDLIPFENGVNSIAVTKFPDMNQNQFDALCSYAYNRGLGKSDGSNGLRQLIYNSNTLEEVSANFTVYWGTAEAYKDALISRREKERALFDTPVSDDSDSEYDEELYNNFLAIEKAIEWAVGIANDDSHGYDQSDRWGLDYDCSSLVIQAYENAGIPVKTNGATYTGNMCDVFVATGFEKLDVVDGMQLLRGDVLWRNGHTAMYLGDESGCMIVSAHINELGTTTGGQVGDQTTHEIDVSSFFDSGTWTYVLRLPSSSQGGSVTPEPEPDKIKRKRLSSLLLMSLLADRF